MASSNRDAYYKRALAGRVGARLYESDEELCRAIERSPLSVGKTADDTMRVFKERWAAVVSERYGADVCAHFLKGVETEMKRAKVKEGDTITVRLAR